ncbi:DNA-binding protein [Bradyrhizobium sp. B097]|uniref:DNA-binding protein n=1 Tax=Bradyrhizobium sp. B097 TaxID=3140244 RepID=UPI0031842C8D
MSRQFTDGEIVAAIRAIAAEGRPLSRATVRKRLGGGGSTRISAILKEYAAGAHGPGARSGPNGPVRSGAAGPASAAAEGKAVRASADVPPPAVAAPAATSAPSDGRESEGGIAQLQSEIRVLKILLESERNARREDEARHARTIEALQREIEIASGGWTDRDASGARPSRTPGAPEPRSRTRP